MLMLRLQAPADTAGRRGSTWASSCRVNLRQGAAATAMQALQQQQQQQQRQQQQRQQQQKQLQQDSSNRCDDSTCDLVKRVDVVALLCIFCH